MRYDLVSWCIQLVESQRHAQCAQNKEACLHDRVKWLVGQIDIWLVRCYFA